MIMNLKCAFSGHRNLNIGGYDDGLLERVISDLIKTGVKTFYCGMALGFDMQAAEKVVEFKKKTPIRLVACLPCGGQSETFSLSSERRYKEILKNCDTVITLAPEYYNGCMHRRNRFMVDNSDILVCFLRKNSGGTCYTVKYAERFNKKIIKI